MSIIVAVTITIILLLISIIIVVVTVTTSITVISHDYCYYFLVTSTFFIVTLLCFPATIMYNVVMTTRKILASFFAVRHLHLPEEVLRTSSPKPPGPGSSRLGVWGLRFRALQAGGSEAKVKYQ